MLSLSSAAGTSARNVPKTEARPQRVTFDVTAEVDAETLIDAFGERFAIVINDAGLSREEARRIGLESLRKAYRVFRRGAAK